VGDIETLIDDILRMAHELGVDDRFGLPSRVSSLRWFKDAVPVNAPFYSVVRHNPNGGYDAQIVDSNGDVYLQLEGYQTVELPAALSDMKTGPIKALFNTD